MKRIIKYALCKSVVYTVATTLVTLSTLLGFSRGIWYVFFASVFILLSSFFGTIIHWYTYKSVGKENDYWDDEEFLEKY